MIPQRLPLLSIQSSVSVIGPRSRHPCIERTYPIGTHIRKVFQDKRVYQREDRCIRANGQRKCEENGERERRLTRKLPCAEPQIAQEVLEEEKRAPISLLLLQKRSISKLSSRRPRRLRRGNSRVDQALRQQFEMICKLFMELIICSSVCEESSQLRGLNAQKRQHGTLPCWHSSGYTKEVSTAPLQCP